MKYQEIYRWGMEQLQEAGIQEAGLDARLLLEEICGTDRNDLLAHGEREIPEDKYAGYAAVITRRKMRMPLQQITGHQEFMGLTFKVTPDVLIPRQDTEILAEEAMRYLHDGMHILDMCTGSGCILLSLLHYSNGCEGTGCDISEKALAVAKENAAMLSQEAVFVQSDLFNHIEGKYDLIVSNPPYIPTGVIPALMKEVRDYEPKAALDGGGDGLYFYRRIIQEAENFLYPEGMLFFETGYDQARTVSQMMKEAGFSEVTICRDFAGLDRVVHGIYGVR